MNTEVQKNVVYWTCPFDGACADLSEVQRMNSVIEGLKTHEMLQLPLLRACPELGRCHELARDGVALGVTLK